MQSSFIFRNVIYQITKEFPEEVDGQLVSLGRKDFEEFSKSFWNWLERNIFKAPSMKIGDNQLFNPYLEINIEVDVHNANQIRQENLINYLKSFISWPDILILGEAPGWRGCRFSGVPFTSEAQLTTGVLPFTGSPSSNRNSPFSEATATIFWKVMKPHHPRFLIWNCIPFHPYKSGQPLSNRSPSRAEIAYFTPILVQLIDLVNPKRLIVVGRTAQNAIQKLGIPFDAVRHPSHGGARIFETGLARNLAISL